MKTFNEFLFLRENMGNDNYTKFITSSNQKEKEISRLTSMIAKDNQNKQIFWDVYQIASEIQPPYVKSDGTILGLYANKLIIQNVANALNSVGNALYKFIQAAKKDQNSFSSMRYSTTKNLSGGGYNLSSTNKTANGEKSDFDDALSRIESLANTFEKSAQELFSNLEGR